MSKIKELDSIAEAVADNIKEVMFDSVGWAVDGTVVDGLSGDEFFEACDYIIGKAVEKLAIELLPDYKQNTNTVG